MLSEASPLMSPTQTPIIQVAALDVDLRTFVPCAERG